MPCAPAPSPSTGTCTPTRLLEADPSPAGCRAGRRGQPPQVPGLRTLPPGDGAALAARLAKMPCHAQCGHRGHTNWEGRRAESFNELPCRSSNRLTLFTEILLMRCLSEGSP